jgi:hypothetical protein
VSRRFSRQRSFKLGVQPELLRVLPLDTPVTVEGGVQARGRADLAVILASRSHVHVRSCRVRARARR